MKDRNDPYSCGSENKSHNAEKCVRGKIVKFSNEPRFTHDILNALKLFFEKRKAEETSQIICLDWIIHDFVLKKYKKPLIELFYLEHGPNLPDAEKIILKGWLDTVTGVYEVSGIEKGKGIYIQDIFNNNNTEYFVNDISTSNAVRKWDILPLRIIPVGDKYHLSGGTCVIPQNLKRELLEFGKYEFSVFRKEYPKASFREFMKRDGYKFFNFLYTRKRIPPIIVTPEGNPIVLAKAIYKVNDYEAAVKALKNLQELKIVESNKDELNFDWLVKIIDHRNPAGQQIFQTDFLPENGEESLRVMGSVTINKKNLTIDCLSLNRLSRLKSMLEYPGDSISFVSESKEYPKFDGEIRKESVKKIPEIPEPLREELMKKALEDHYRRWVDMPLPPLDGMTPTEASKTPAGRIKLMEVLKMIENGEERRSKDGKLYYDVRKLRKVLGIE